MPAIRAVVVAEMSDVRGAIVVGRAAADAVLRVGGVLEGGPGNCRIVHAVDDARAERPDLRVVAVQDEDGPRAELGDGRAPAPGDQLELAIAVELVAKEVAEADGPGADAAEHLGERSLIDLEQAELGTARGEQRRGDAGDEIRTRMVVGQAKPGAEDLGRHRRRRGLAVRRRDDGDSGRQASGEPVDCTWVELREQLARHRHPGAPPEQPREGGNAACSGYLGGETHGSSVCDDRGTSIE